MELIKLVADFLQENLKIPRWPDDPRFYALGPQMTFECPNEGIIIVTDRRHQLKFEIYDNGDNVRIQIKTPFSDPLEVRNDVNELHIVDLFSCCTIYVDMHAPDALEKLGDIINNPMPKIKHGSQETQESP
jgi:hypothetical protein